MARFIGIDETAARAALGAAGVQFVRALDDEGTVDTALIELVLPADVRYVRTGLAAEPPTDADSFSGMGAWHVNAVDELHSVIDGEGIMEFWTGQGAVSVLVGAGDVVLIQQAEHRYRPLTLQNWLARWSGTPDSDLGARDTGRESAPWPVV